MQLCGLDLDNTIICYDQAFPNAARERGLVGPDFAGGKRELKDDLRRRGPAGERAWQELQGYVYGAGIHLAKVFPGVMHFLSQARVQGLELAIVSHKTQHGHFDPDQVDLRDAARGFLQLHGILEYINPERIFFCATRELKLQKINELQCTFFIDDLEDILGDATFPAHTQALHFAPEDTISSLPTFASWTLLHHHVLHEMPATAS